MPSVPDLITQAAQSAGVDPALAIAVAMRESSLNQAAVGSAGEQGVFQLMPSTAAGLSVDPTDLHQNIAGGVAYLAQQLRTFGGDQAKALAAYNCGPGCVRQAITAGGDNWFAHIPPSTQAYVTSILGNAVGTTPTVTQAAGAISSPDEALAVPPSFNTGTSAGAPPAVLLLGGVGLLAVLALGSARD